MTRTTAELRQYLAGEWLFNNDFKDTSGNSNDGTPIDIEWKPTSKGMKPRFNGSSSLVDCGNDSSLQGTTDITIVALIKINSVINTTKTIISKSNIFLEDRFTFYIYGSEVGAYKESSNDGGITLSGGNVTANNWYQAAFQFGSSGFKLYLNGVEVDSDVSTTVLNSGTHETLKLGTRYADEAKLNGTVSTVLMYNTAFTPTEILNLYNETKGEYGVIEAERSYQHNPDDVIDSSDAVGAWGTAKESTTELVDLSGNGNIADIHGAMPTEGFIQGRRFDNANENYLDCGNDSSLNITDAMTSSAWIYPITNVYGIIFKKYQEPDRSWRLYRYTDNYYYLSTGADGGDSVRSGAHSELNEWIHITVVWDGSINKIYINGVDETINLSNYNVAPAAFPSAPFRIGGTVNFWNGYINSARINNSAWSEIKIKQDINTIARLPFWSINYTDYPDNVTTYTDHLPYSSSVISSGTFKVDDDKLQCVSAGTITYSASYKFDGNEYIKVDIDGVEYAGTGTITQGNTTVSVAQGSNKITITMGTGDTIGKKIDIQFREEV